MTNFDPRNKLHLISTNSPQLWSVAYIEKENSVFCAEKDLNNATEGGADGVVFINEFSEYEHLHSVIKELRAKYLDVKIGANYLGNKDDPYGYKGTFFLSKEYQLQIAWTDFSGIDLIKERPPISLHEIEAERPRDVFYCSGIHMKYSTLIDQSKSLIESAYQAIGWVDGILLTGPTTGVLPNPHNVIAVKSAVGNYPLGLASGVSTQNAHLVKRYIDFCLVGTSLFDKEGRIERSKVSSLKNALQK